MEAIFLKIVNMSITSGYLALIIIALRLLLKKAPKSLRCMMWAFVGIRLICPISIESILSLIPSAETIPRDILVSETPTINSGISFVNQIVNPAISQTVSQNSVSLIQNITNVASVIWIIGMSFMLAYMLISYLCIHKKVLTAVEIEKNVWICDYVTTPFILGIFRPKVCLPSSIDERDVPYVISHEKAHLKRHDHIWKPIGFLLLAIYWFNPVLWIAYILLCRDIELACDEKVIKELGIAIKKPYSDALINCSTHVKIITACPLAFGEVGVKERVKNVLNYKKPKFWIVISGVLACMVITVCLLTNPVDSSKKSKSSTGTSDETEFKEAYNNIQNEIKNEYTIDNSELEHLEEMEKVIETMDVLSKMHNDYIIYTEKIYTYTNSPDPLDPRLVLCESNKTFQFIWSGFSSYIAVGEYDLSNGILTCITSDGEYKYTFVYDERNNSFVFSASDSSKIPQYKYSSWSEETITPVPDGATFVIGN